MNGSTVYTLVILLLLQIISLFNNFAGLYPVINVFFWAQICGLLWNVVLTGAIFYAILKLTSDDD